MTKSYFYYFILFFFFASPTIGKNNADSLLQSLKETKDQKAQISILLRLFDLYERNKPDSALKIAQEALRISKSLNDDDLVTAKLYYKLGHSYVSQGEYYRALDYMFKILKILEKNDNTELRLLSYKDLGVVESELENFESAMEYFEKAMDIAKGSKDELSVGDVLHNFGRLYMLKNDYERSLEYHKRNLKIRKDLNENKGFANSLMNIGEVYQMKKDYNLALQYLQEAEVVCSKNNYAQELAVCRILIAETYFHTNNLKTAKEYAYKALRFFISSRNKVLLKKSYEILYKIFLREKDYKKATEYQSLYIVYEDSLFNERKLRNIYDLENNAIISEKNFENESLKKREDENRNTITLQFILLLCVGLAFLMAVLLIISFNRQINNRKRYAEQLLSLNQELSEKNEKVEIQTEELRKASEEIAKINSNLESMVEERTKQLQQVNQELDMFIYHSSHDFRRPLTSLIGLYQLSQLLSNEKDLKELFENVRVTAETMDKMLLKLMMVSDIGNKNLEVIQLKPRHFRSTISHIQQIYIDEISKNQIDFQTEISPDIAFQANDTLIHTILFILIENAVSFCGKVNPTIQIKIHQNENKELVILIRDNGQGIDEEFKSRIYEMYFRANENSKGNGLGLYVLNKAIQKLQGHISFDSKLNQFTEFVIQLPNQNTVKETPA